MKRVLCVFGTRPEVIKMAPVIHALSRTKGIKVFSCDTGQHKEMSRPILKWFGINPTFRLNLMKHNQTLSGLMSDALVKIDQLLLKTQPDVVLCQGDTTTAMVTSIAAFHRKIKVGHVEAGLRTWNKNLPWPEEINRRIIDLVAEFYFAPTRPCQKNLLNEHVDPKSIFITGNSTIDALLWTVKKLNRSPLSLKSWPANLRKIVASYSDKKSSKRKFVLITAHRRESFGNGMLNIAKAVEELARRFPEIDWIFPVHLNPNVRKVMMPRLSAKSNIYLCEPLNYAQFCWGISNSTLLLTDSGGIQEEAPSLGKPVVVMRDVTERPEGVAAGAVKLAGCTKSQIVKITARLLSHPSDYRKMARVRHIYGNGKTGDAIAKILHKKL